MSNHPSTVQSGRNASRRNASRRIAAMGPVYWDPNSAVGAAYGTAPQAGSDFMPGSPLATCWAGASAATLQMPLETTIGYLGGDSRTRLVEACPPVTHSSPRALKFSGHLCKLRCSPCATGIEKE
ncbi:hypothetical protein NDU88_007111 [Pleurodeles waltl]|uniref:Uncharacterized protein n=1 Tax=Pleurodeles waltl TaxID=8319 RepID=A0AAV7QQX1_PLEWA|nr:hypothetical protein NDU88_007111 [Pleurodeles waltl]